MQTTGFVWGNGLYQPGEFYFSGFREAQDVQIFLGFLFATNAIPEKYWASDEGAGVKKNKNYSWIARQLDSGTSS